MSSAVVEKNFVWRFIDKVTQGVKEARNAMQEAEEAMKSLKRAINGLTMVIKPKSQLKRLQTVTKSIRIK